ERVHFIFGTVLSHVLHAAERERPHHPEVLHVLAIDLRQLRVAGRPVIAVHHQPVLRLVLGIDEAIRIDRHLVLGDERDTGTQYADERGGQKRREFRHHEISGWPGENPGLRELCPAPSGCQRFDIFFPPSPLRGFGETGPRHAPRCSAEGAEAGIWIFEEENEMEPEKPKRPTEAAQLYNEFIHGHISRREFFDGAKKFAVGGLAAGTIIDMLMPDYAA